MPGESLITRIREYNEITNVGPILRRYFVIGAFDGALTVLGIIFGGIAVGAGEESTILILAMSFSAAIALSISSLVGAFEAERVEKRLDQMSMERAMLSEISETHRDAFRFATIASAGIHCIAPLLAALVPLIPFLVLSFNIAAPTSIIITFSFLFVMGAYLGGLTKERAYLTGLRFVIAGLATAIVIWLIGGPL